MNIGDCSAKTPFPTASHIASEPCRATTRHTQPNESDSAGCIALHPRLFTGDRYAAASLGPCCPGAELRSGLKPSASCGGGVRSECNRDRRFSQLFMYLSHYSRFSPQNTLHASSCPQDAGNSGRFYGLVTFEPLVNLASKGYREWFRFAALEVREIHARLRSAGLRFVSPEASALNRCK